MSLRLPDGGEAGAGLRQALLRLARAARRDLESVGDGPERRIHRLRTGMKKYRSLLRLGRKWLPCEEWEAAKERVRLLKDGLAGSRDETVIFETVSSVLGAEIAERHGIRPASSSGKVEAPDSMREAARELVGLTRRFDFPKLTEGKLKKRWKKTWRKSRDAGRLARKTGVAEDFHRWRKRVKDLWYQSVVLGGVAGRIGTARGPARRLSDTLGEEHDLTMVLGSVGGLGRSEKRRLEEVRNRLRAAAARRAARLFGA